jgi:hydroxypyruvate isomerase
LLRTLRFYLPNFPFLDRFAAAKQAGFSGVEMLFPFAYAPEAITEQLKLHDLTLVLHNTPAPDWDAGDRGLAALPGQETAFRREFARCLRYAEQLQPEHIHIMAGLSAGPDARRTFIKNLRWAAAQSPHQSFTIEPINSHDMPGYFLNDFDLALDILEEVGADNLGLQFDVYHAQRITGDSDRLLGQNVDCGSGISRLLAIPVATSPWGATSIIRRFLRAWMRAATGAGCLQSTSLASTRQSQDWAG